MLVPHNIRRLLLLNRSNNVTVRCFSGVVDDTRNGIMPNLPRLQRPPPGRLARNPRAAADTKSAGTSDSIDESIQLENKRMSRIEERKAAIERRRVFLEKGVSSSVAESSPETEGVKIIYESESPTNTIESRTTKTSRSSVHSLNKGRKLSAADLHRLQRSTQKPDSEPRLSPQPISKENTIVEHRLRRESRTNQIGGSVVASQSATTRYRLQRQQQYDGENNLKMNPSVITIPPDQNLKSNAPKSDDFEERLKRLRREKQKEDESSSWFSWFWSK